ncbi:MAG: carboxylating nicotinate-nucleotide diphosphorylase [Candidatus Omnitrophica bacterium]|nr:carboxylating nicotinate-nucleotide diphosphorylase [Candidatus Omnitrophota bacterium]MCM8826310.1 carboxylating nicotinate-nucleotide diphosphorylase [Candidatus Omnitrophota bacterium]
MYLNKSLIKKIVKQALEEDIGKGDVTTNFIIPPRLKIRAVILAKEKGVLCGVDLAKEIFSLLDKRLKFVTFKKDGQVFGYLDRILEISGYARPILTGERVALNFLSHLSGIATYTKEFVGKVNGLPVKIMDTRKTTPGLRILEKYAVKTGGGKNHRYGLWEAILIKDNHLRAIGIIKNKRLNENLLCKVINTIRKKTELPIEIEVENLDEFKKVIKYNPDIVMLDNFDLSSLHKAVVFRNRNFPSVKLEVSGRVNISNVRKIAESGVDFISVGAITHSSQCVDFSLEIYE